MKQHTAGWSRTGHQAGSRREPYAVSNEADWVDLDEERRSSAVLPGVRKKDVRYTVGLATQVQTRGFLVQQVAQVGRRAMSRCNLE